MVKKFSKAAEAKATESNLLDTVKASSSQIWSAGLGAFSKAQAEGSKVFEALAKEGTDLQKKFRSLADSRMSDMTHEVSGKVTAASSKAAEAWSRLETVFEDRVGRAVGGLGVPTKADFTELTQRVEALAKQVQKLNAARVAPAKAAPVKAVRAAATVKKPAPRKPAAKK